MHSTTDRDYEFDNVHPWSRYVLKCTPTALLIVPVVCLPAFAFSACPIDTTLSAPLLIVGIGILLPVIVALAAYVSDAKQEQQDEELVSLLYVCNIAQVAV